MSLTHRDGLSIQVRNAGFTLVELLVVIAVIGFLSSVTLVVLTSARLKAHYATLDSDITQLMKAIDIARGESGKVMIAVTNNTCTWCACSPPLQHLPSLPPTHSCIKNWGFSLGDIEDATNGIITGLDQFLYDPWGSPYLLDENETEGGLCDLDTLTSAGPDGRFPNADDINYDIPPSGYCT